MENVKGVSAKLRNGQLKMDNGQWEMLKVGSVEKCTKNVEKCIFIGFFLQFIWSCQLFFVTLQRIIRGEDRGEWVL